MWCIKITKWISTVGKKIQYNQEKTLRVKHVDIRQNKNKRIRGILWIKNNNSRNTKSEKLCREFDLKKKRKEKLRVGGER